MLNQIALSEHILVTLLISSNVFTTYFVYPILPDILNTFGGKDFELLQKGLFFGVI